MLVNLNDYARSVVEKKSSEEACKVLIRMKDRFYTVFSHEKDSMPRVWTGKEDIRKITKDARAAALKLLSVMVAIRLDEKPDKIENILNSALTDGPVAQERGVAASTDLLASSTWEEIPPKNTLITPVQCKSLWRQLKMETEYMVTQAISAQEAHKRNNNWLPPPWAIVTIAILGFNEFMVLLRNPLYLMVIFVLFLVSRALWVQIDVTGEFRNGTLSGLLSLSSRFLPTVMNLLRRLAEAGQGQHEAPQPPQPPQPPTAQGFRSKSLSAPSYRSQSQSAHSFRSQSLKKEPSVFNPAPESSSSSSSTVSSPRNGKEYTNPSTYSCIAEIDTEASSTS